MIYISGPITSSDKDEYRKNIKRFSDIQLILNAQGLDTYNPAIHDELHPDWTYEQYLVNDILVIVDQKPDMFFMKKWEQSRGARIEMELAKRFGLKIDFE